MNGEPLDFGHGAPLRLRNESEHGLKQVKWLGGIEFVRHFSELGAGYGGYNQDHEFFGYRHAIWTNDRCLRQHPKRVARSQYFPDPNGAPMTAAPPATPAQSDRRNLMVGKGWIQAVALVVIFGFFVMGILAFWHRPCQAPPIQPGPDLAASARALLDYSQLPSRWDLPDAIHRRTGAQESSPCWSCTRQAVSSAPCTISTSPALRLSTWRSARSSQPLR
jgi:Oxidoreductase molybdopterin binding domain